MKERISLITVTQCQAENRTKSLNLMAVTEGDYFSKAQLKKMNFAIDDLQRRRLFMLISGSFETEFIYALGHVICEQC